MFLPKGTNKNKDGYLEISGVSTLALSQKYGTPLYIYNINLVRERMKEFKNALKKYHPNGKVAFASKACSMVPMLSVVKEEGILVDVVSAGELYTALKAGIDPSMIHFHGNNKGIDEIRYALDQKIGCFIVDNFYELEMLGKETEKRKEQVSILLRLSPGVEAHTHEYIITGQEDSKFGFDVGSGMATEALKKALLSPYLSVDGIHSHIGSQIFETIGFTKAVEVLMKQLIEWKNTLGYEAKVFNVGGGFGIQYTKEDTPLPIDQYIFEIVDVVKKECAQHHYLLPSLWFEPGRILVGDAGHTLYTIGAQKMIPNIRNYISVDGGMSDNIRTALYQAEYAGVVANKMNEKRDQLYSVAGKCCESGDMLIWDIELPKVESGDLLTVFCTGAYGYSMASNYNRMLKPAVVFIEEGEDTLVVKRQTFETLVQDELEYEKPLGKEKV